MDRIAFSCDRSSSSLTIVLRWDRTETRAFNVQSSRRGLASGIEKVCVYVLGRKPFFEIAINFCCNNVFAIIIARFKMTSFPPVHAMTCITIMRGHPVGGNWMWCRCSTFVPYGPPHVRLVYMYTCSTPIGDGPSTKFGIAPAAINWPPLYMQRSKCWQRFFIRYRRCIHNLYRFLDVKFMEI